MQLVRKGKWARGAQFVVLRPGSSPKENSNVIAPSECERGWEKMSKLRRCAKILRRENKAVYSSNFFKCLERTMNNATESWVAVENK